MQVIQFHTYPMTLQKAISLVNKNLKKTPKKQLEYNLSSFHTVNIQFSPFPKCVLMLMYLAVPVRLLCSLYGICL